MPEHGPCCKAADRTRTLQGHARCDSRLRPGSLCPQRNRRCHVVESKRPIVEADDAAKEKKKDQSPNEELAQEERPTTQRPA